MKKKLSRWLRMNRRELILLLCSMVIIIGSVIGLKITTNSSMIVFIIIASLLIEMIVGIRLNNQNLPPIAGTYFLAYTTSFIGVTITDFLCIIGKEQANNFTYALLISGALFLYILGLLIMHQPEEDETPPHYPPINSK